MDINLINSVIQDLILVKIAQLVLATVIFVFAMMVLYSIYCNEIKKSMSYKHRKFLADMYVAGKIRQIAKEDNIDLELEAVEMKKTIKLIEAKPKDLDDVIEQVLQERIEREADEAAEKAKLKT